MRQIALLTAALALAGCTTVSARGTPESPPKRDVSSGECDASRAQHLLGTSASPAVGAQLLSLTGAAILRWVPPRTAVTMDYRMDRLTVSYDDNMIIERISCG